MSAYVNDPRVTPDDHFGDERYKVTVPQGGIWSVVPYRDAWLAACDGTVESMAQPGFSTADDAIRYLIGDPR